MRVLRSQKERLEFWFRRSSEPENPMVGLDAVTYHHWIHFLLISRVYSVSWWAVKGDVVTTVLWSNNWRLEVEVALFARGGRQ